MEIFNIYKQKGYTSFDVVALVRKKLGIKKVGHAGTLDPMAEGVLIVLVGDACKKQSEFTKLEKEYKAEVAFGFETDTYDAEGEITKKSEGEGVLTEEKVREALQSFVGTISQTVPAYSAVKIKGRKLYELARKGKTENIELPSREVTIYKIEVEKFEKKYVEKISAEVNVLTCVISCGSGTYIRSLAHDLGEKLGTYATLIKLVRTKVGDFSVSDSVLINEILK